METFKIQGRNKLQGEVEIKGSKNATFAVLAATVLCPGPVTLRNIPQIRDVLLMLDILEQMGAAIQRRGSEVTVDCREIKPEALPHTAVRKIRGSVALMGSLVALFGEFSIPEPGGCKIGSRALEAHIEALRDFGCEIDIIDDVMHVKRGQKSSSRIVLREFSVTATEILVLAAVGSHADLEIRIAAGADHPVQELCWFLQSLGADISGIGSATLRIRPAELHQVATYDLMPDPIEVGTFLCLAGTAQAEITLRNCAPEFLWFELETYKRMGLNFDFINTRKSQNGHYELTDIVVHKSSALRPIKKLHDMPAPGFLPDLLQPTAVMLTQAQGISLIYDWMYDGRLKYVEELNKMGADMKILDPHRVLIVGPTPLYGREITSYDLRAGATLIIASLVAEGESTIRGIDQIDRGYENIDERLRNIGADIQRQKVVSEGTNQL